MRQFVDGRCVDGEIENIKISDLLMSDAKPFQVMQAQTYTADRWTYEIGSVAGKLKNMESQSLKESDLTSRDWLKLLKTIHSMYRVQSFYYQILDKKPFPPITVTRDYKKFPGLVLVDGRHRLWAYILHGYKTVDALVIK